VLSVPILNEEDKLMFTLQIETDNEFEAKIQSKPTSKKSKPGKSQQSNGALKSN